MIATDAACVAADPHLAFVIDDDADMRQFISTTLSQLGMKAETFQTAKEALASTERGHPAVIFLDVALLHSDALDVIRGLSKLGYLGTVQLMSGGRPALLEAVKRIGIRHRLTLAAPLQKPFALEAIVQLIATLASARASPQSDEQATAKSTPVTGG